MPTHRSLVSRPIDWELVKQQYHEMIRLASALYTRTADPEAILRRFTRGATAYPLALVNAL
nr:Tn3 family transposase [Pseudovibrio sp. Tun.PSC04-5.I4]